MRKFAVILYRDFSLQEITCLRSALPVWCGETIDYIASENKEYRSEEGQLLSVKEIWKQEKEMLKQDKKMEKWKEKRWKRINKRIERTVSFMAILIIAVFSVLEVLEKGDRKFIFKKLSFDRFSYEKPEEV